MLTITMALVGIIKPIMVGESDVIEQSTTQPIVEEIEPTETTELDLLVETTETTETTTETVVESATIAPEEKEQVQVTFRVTAYCACFECCGDYALNRPLDENGNEIVYGASSTRLTTGVSCASPLPFGTKINLDGYGTVVVQDRTAQWVVDKYGENIIDIYFDNHQVASNFGCHYMKGVVV